MEWNKRRTISLWFLFGLAFVCQMLAGVVGIAVPIYARLHGASHFMVGLIGAAGGSIYSFVPFVSGRLCDRSSRKAFVSGSLISYGLSCLLYSLTEDPLLLVFIKALEWSSIGAFWPAMEALIADSGDAQLEETLKRFNLSWGTAMIVGPLIGGVLISVWSAKAPFYISLVVSWFFGLLSLVVIAEPSRKHDANTDAGIKPRGDMENQSPIVAALTSIFLFSSIVGIILSLFPSYAVDLEISPFEIGLITLAFGASRVVAFHQANRIEARLKRPRMFLLGTTALAIGSLLTFYSSSVPLFMFCFLVFGFGAGISYAASISSVLRRWRSSRGYAAGVFESLIGLGYFAGPLIGGAISGYAPNAPYMYGFVLSSTVFFIQLAFRKRGSTT
ncbi:MAG: MFS transporter [Candidatus Bathyarchaeota archaeon]|nr:MFS transporter [Candidatus Bathyarchaeota archaeon]